jgi:transposase
MQFRGGHPDGLRRAGRPRKLPGAAELDLVAKAMRVKDLAMARKRISELERKIGQQQVDLDFFRQAVRQVRGARRPSAEAGVTASMRSSKR